MMLLPRRGEQDREEAFRKRSGDLEKIFSISSECQYVLYSEREIVEIPPKAAPIYHTLTTSRRMPFSELTSNHFLDGMKKIFELEPFINLEQGEGFYKRESEAKVMTVGY